MSFVYCVLYPECINTVYDKCVRASEEKVQVK